MSARLLARTGAILARIDGVLDDPYPAAVARLPGVAGSYWLCHQLDEIRVGTRYADLDDDPLCFHDVAETWPDDVCDIEYQDERAASKCWADRCYNATATTGVGLCEEHHAEIVTGAHHYAEIKRRDIRYHLDAEAADRRRVLALFDLPDHIVAPIPAPTEENPTT